MNSHPYAVLWFFLEFALLASAQSPESNREVIEQKYLFRSISDEVTEKVRVALRGIERIHTVDAGTTIQALIGVPEDTKTKVIVQGISGTTGAYEIGDNYLVLFSPLHAASVRELTRLAVVRWTAEAGYSERLSPYWQTTGGPALVYKYIDQSSKSPNYWVNVPVDFPRWVEPLRKPTLVVYCYWHTIDKTLEMFVKNSGNESAVLQKYSFYYGLNKKSFTGVSSGFFQNPTAIDPMETIRVTLPFDPADADIVDGSSLFEMEMCGLSQAKDEIQVFLTKFSKNQNLLIKE